MAELATPNRQDSFLPENLAAELFGRGRVVALDAGQSLFQAGDASTGCYQVIEGLLKVSFEMASGRERILAILGPGALVGELSVIDGAPRSACVAAIRDAKLRFVSRAAFDEFGRGHPEIYRAIATVLARRLRDINASLAVTSFLTVKGRAARTLLVLAEAFGKDVGGGRILIRQKVNQSDLAAMTGIARENLSRILQDWMRAKLVTRLAGYYCVENTTALEQEAGL